MRATIHTAANGHLTFSMNELPDALWELLEVRLVNEYGLKRVGSIVIGVSERIHLNFECPAFTLASGWDNWSGHYLLSESEAGDRFLKTLFDRGIG